MLNINDLLDERYEITGRIGQGGMSYVYRAVDKKLGREVAIKVLKEELSADEEFVERFKNEARSAARLTHPNIVAAYDIVDSGELHYIVMELVEGISLKNYIAKKGVLTNKETIGIALQAASGISEAHKNGIVHRDVKPQNIIISKDGKIKVADFGIAQAAAEDEKGNHIVIGSAHYMAPEQAKTGITDARSDIYSLGISMYEMITGVLPYDGEDTVSIVMAHIQNVLVPPSVYNHDIYPALNDIIVKATKKDPDERYQTADELIEDLRHAVNDPTGHFVKLFDSAARPAEAVDQKNDPVENEADTKGTKPQNEGTGEAKSDAASEGGRDAKEEQSETPEKTDAGSMEPHDGKKPAKGSAIKRMAPVAALIAIVLGLGIFSLIMIKRAGDPELMASLAETEEVEAASLSPASEAETEMDYTISISGEDLMPDLLGVNVDTARARLADLQLSMDSSSEAYSDVYEAGEIINQEPAKGTIITSETTVFVTVSKGSVLDDLQNDSVASATDKLVSEGYTVDNTTEQVFSDVVQEGNVCGYTLLDENGQPISLSPPEESLQEGSAAETESSGADGETESPQGSDTARPDSKWVRLSVSRGSESGYSLMPDLSGKTRAAAALELGTAELKLGKVTALNSSEYAAGMVAGQSAAAGEYIKKGTSVDISLSVGSGSGIVDGTDITDSTEINLNPGTASGQSQSLSDEYFYGDIDTSCSIGSKEGPGASDHINVGIRLRQQVNGSDEYTQLMDPIPVALGSRIPVTFRNIRGAYGVTEGYVEVFDADTMEIFATYSISFGPAS